MMIMLNLTLISQVNSPIVIERPKDFEYLMAPDSTGKRNQLKMPSLEQSVLAQRMKLPYPILFIHGLWSGSDTWDASTNFMDSQYGLTFGGRIDFCLNFDGNNNTTNVNFYPTNGADLALFQPTLIDGDYYYLNFDVGSNGMVKPFLTYPYNVASNEQAVFKQGLAVKWAIYYILKLTGRDKVVLMGHSMGGLASREYLQNPALWQADGQTHVAKLVTTGTPHGGSNTVTAGALYGPDGQSEAVRDLRAAYYYSGNSGTYLFGGKENLSYMNDQFCCYFYNSDVNCNGITGETITGLNQKSIYTNVDYSCIIGECTGCVLGKYTGDGVVNDYSANLNNFYTGLNANLFYYNASAAAQIHTNLPNQYYQNMQGLDEPNNYLVAYNIGFDKIYTGFTTIQSNASYPDYDDYKFKISSTGNVNVHISNIALADFGVHILDLNSKTVGSIVYSAGSSTIDFSQFLTAGSYYLEIFGTPTSASYLYPYNFALNFNSSTVGINDTPPKAEINIYPNPSTGNFVITQNIAVKSEVEIFNIVGERVYITELLNIQATIDLSKEAKGVYYVKVTDTYKNITNKRIVIQ